MAQTVVRGLREQIINHVRNNVLSGRLAAGEHIREVDLAKKFRVSRSPIREALIQLTQEGLLVAEPNRGVRVAALPSDKVIRGVIVPTRQIIETFALDGVFDELGEPDLAEWDLILQRMQQACLRGDVATLAEEDIAFHRHLLERAGQPDLLMIWSAILNRIRSHFRADLNGGRTIEELLRIYQEHVAIIEAIRRRDRQAALDHLVVNIT
jgi:DNA-binding GntR family transcriptional regulator